MATLEGAAEFAAGLRSLPTEVREKVLRAGAFRGAAIVRAAVERAAPARQGLFRRGKRLVPGGTLKRAVVAKYAPEKSSPTAESFVVAIRRGKAEQASGRDAFYATWVELGHRIVPRKVKGDTRSLRVRRKASTGGARVPPHPYFIPAYRASYAQALETMRSVTEERLAKAVQGNGRSS